MVVYVPFTDKRGEAERLSLDFQTEVCDSLVGYKWIYPVMTSIVLNEYTGERTGMERNRTDQSANHTEVLFLLFYSKICVCMCTMSSIVKYYLILLQYYCKAPEPWVSVEGLKTTGLSNLSEVTQLAICEARVQIQSFSRAYTLDLQTSVVQ